MVFTVGLFFGPDSPAFERRGQSWTTGPGESPRFSSTVRWRIDCFLISKSLRPRLKRAFIQSDVEGSDHCPVGIKLARKKYLRIYLAGTSKRTYIHPAEHKLPR
jgi:hypothetical protein